MNEFVNRDGELALIDDALDTLIESKFLLRTPVIGFYGIRGIGKTTLLSRIVEKCADKQVHHYAMVNGQQNLSQYFMQIMNELKELLEKKEPVVVILDDWDAVSPEQLREVETVLSDLANDSNLFVILTGRSKEAFDRTASEKTSSLSRKLRRTPLKPFDRKHCDIYIDRFYYDIEPALRHFIFEWTHGYPAALKVMIDAMRTDQLDLRLENDRVRLLSMMTERIINQGFFADVGSDTQKLFELHSLFSVLSVPRRFNIIVMQDIIEQYAPSRYRRKGPPAYVSLPKEINKILHVLDWDDAGYHIDIVVRNIFLLKFSTEQSQQYQEIHDFLAELNKKFAETIEGLDHIRYIREYCYHLAKGGAIMKRAQILQEGLEQLLSMQSWDEIIQFYREFSLDEDLKEALGENVRVIITLLRKGFFDLYDQITDDQRRIDCLRCFLLCSSSSTASEDLVLLLEQGILQIKQEETPEIITGVCNKLAADSGLRTKLGKASEHIDALLGRGSSQER